MSVSRASRGAKTLRSAMLGASLSLAGSMATWAQPANPASPATASASVGQGPAWADLKPAQREALKPLENDWSGIDSQRKRKWLEIADRYPGMSPKGQARLQNRMTEWVRMTPLERGEARLNYQGLKQLPARDRQASWEAYQALPPQQRRDFAERAARSSGDTVGRHTAPPSGTPSLTDKPSPGAVQPKSNTVPDPTLAPRPTALGATVVHAQPGTTTTLISKPPAPPEHQRTGMPKIAATPEYIDKKTLLPRTGPQSAVRPAQPNAPSAAAARQ